MTYLIDTQAKVVALRGRLIGAGFDPITVAYNLERHLYVVELPIEQNNDALRDWLETEELHIDSIMVLTKTVVLAVSEAIS